MTLRRYIVSEDGRVLKFIQNKEPKPGNPYRGHVDGKFASKKKQINKTTKIWFIDQESGYVTTKEDYDKKIAKILLEDKKEED